MKTDPDCRAEGVPWLRVIVDTYWRFGVKVLDSNS